jgi:hypothetical protein
MHCVLGWSPLLPKEGKGGRSSFVAVFSKVEIVTNYSSRLDDVDEDEDEMSDDIFRILHHRHLLSIESL